MHPTPASRRKLDLGQVSCAGKANTASVKRSTWIPAAAAAICLLQAPGPASGADPDRGRALYGQHCGACHSQSVHGRAKRVATDFAAVRAWVVRWSESLKLGWDASDVDDVAVHLNNTYYRHPCPASACQVISLSQGRPSP